MRFARSFNALEIATRVQPDADPRVREERIELYFKTLENLPIEAIEDGAVHLARTSSWFPKTAEWHDAASEAVAMRFRQTAGKVRDEPWHTEHPECGDTGWLQQECTASSRCGREYCRRQPDDFTHTYVEPCHCRTWNRTWQRNHQPVTTGKAK